MTSQDKLKRFQDASPRNADIFAPSLCWAGHRSPISPEIREDLAKLRDMGAQIVIVDSSPKK